MPSSFERIMHMTVLNKIKGKDISSLSGDELDWLKSRPDIMNVVTEAAKHNRPVSYTHLTLPTKA